MISFEKEICDWKRPTPQVAWIIKTRKEWGRTPHEQPFTGEWSFTLRETIYCPLSWSQHQGILEEMGAKQLIESKSPLSPSLSLPPFHSLAYSSFTLSRVNCPKNTCGDPGWNISARRALRFLPNIFPPFSDTTSKIHSVVPKVLLCRNRDIPTWANIPPLFPMSALQGDMLTTSCALWSKWSQIWLIDPNIINLIHMRVLSRIIFPTADHSWILWGEQLDSFLGNLGNEVCDSSCLTELASENTCMNTLDLGLADNGARVQGFCDPKWVSILDIPHPSLEPRFAWTVSPLHQEGTLKNYYLKT